MSVLFRSMLSISAATVLSRVTGFLRVAVQAAILATGVVANAYTVAALIPRLIYELFLGGIFYSIIIPLLVDRRTNNGEEDARRLTDTLFTLLIPLMGVAALIGFVSARPLVQLATDFGDAPDLSPAQVQEAADLAVLLFRIFVLQMVFYVISTLATGILQSHRRFFLPTFVPVLNNLIIVASFFAYDALDDRDPILAIYVLGIGVNIGIAAMALALVPSMWRLGYRFRPRFSHPALSDAARLAAPMLVLVAASVGVQFFANLFASQFAAIPDILYAFAVFSLPFGIFVVAVATALMPELSEKHSRGDADGYRETFSFGLRLVALVTIPSTVGLVVLAEPVVALLYERGDFGPADTANVATILVAYAVGLLGYGTYFFLIRAFYSRQNTMIPAFLNVALLLVYVALAYGLIQLTESVTGVALALSGANAVIAVAGLAATRYQIKRIGGRVLLRSLAKILFAGGAMYAVARAGVALFGTGSGFFEQAVIVVVVGGASLATYVGAAFLLRVEELRFAAALLRRRRASTGDGVEEN